MIDFVPPELYTPIFYYALLLVVLIVFFQSNIHSIESASHQKFIRNMALAVLLFVLIYMGLRPINGYYFGDMVIYARRFVKYQQGLPLITTKDVAFQAFMKGVAAVTNIGLFFFICTLLYIYPLYKATKNLFSTYWGHAFIVLVASFSFWSYGTNGIRHGIATSLFILGLTYYRKKWFFILLIALACAFHKSMILPSIGLLGTLFYNRSEAYFAIWLLAIPLSLGFEGVWEEFFGSFGFDERFSYFTDDSYAHQFSKVGFRWDFVLYSAIGVFSGWYFVFKKRFDDDLYRRIVNIYLFSNAFWILVIRSSFSNRFAYLSWFLLGLIVIYPLLKNRFFVKQNRVVGMVLLIYFLCSFTLNLVI